MGNNMNPENKNYRCPQCGPTSQTDEEHTQSHHTFEGLFGPKLTKSEAEIAANAVQVQADSARWEAESLRREKECASAEIIEAIAQSRQQLSSKLRPTGGII